MQFISRLNNSVSVIAVHHKNKTLSVLEVVPPQGTDLYKTKTYSYPLKWNYNSKMEISSKVSNFKS